MPSDNNRAVQGLFEEHGLAQDVAVDSEVQESVSAAKRKMGCGSPFEGGRAGGRPMLVAADAAEIGLRHQPKLLPQHRPEGCAEHGAPEMGFPVHFGELQDRGRQADAEAPDAAIDVERGRDSDAAQ